MIQSFDRRSAGRVTDRQDDLRSASIPDCAQWAREYFDQYPNTNVEVIVLYQAIVCTENLIRVDDVMESPKLAE
jgi:hypothetical protein